MKKKTNLRSAFTTPRALFGFALCLLGAMLAVVAISGLTSQSLRAQGPEKKRVVEKAAYATEERQPSGQIVISSAAVTPVLSRPLREQPVIHPSKAPGHDHPEPMQVAPPTEGAGADSARQVNRGAAASAPAPAGVSFDAVGVGLAGFAPASNPPDVNGRVGATQYVQWNNTSFAIFDKTTGALQYGPAAGNTLFQALGGVCATHNDGDPVVSYDILSGRWVLSQFVVNGPAGSFSHQCVAVSQTGDATGAYYLYDFLTDGANFVDYPHTGVWPDGYYMSAHVFNAAGTSYLAGRVYVFERDKMIAGLPARQVSANLDSTAGNQYGFLPADLDSLTPPPAGEASFILGPHPTNLGLTSSTRVAVTWGATPTIALTSATIPTTVYATAPCAGASRACVPQSGQATANGLDNIKSHFMYRLAYRNNGTQAAPQESLLANIPVAGTAPTHDAIRWYEFRNAGDSTATPTVFQQATFDPDTSYRWLGSIAMDNSQNIAMGYSKSSTTIFPAIWITGRLVSDTINTMGAEAQVIAGGGSQGAGAGNRWGDYSSMTLDPVDQCTFYYTNEYLKATGTFNWSTRVASYSFPSCVAAPAWGTVTGTVTSTETGAPVPGVNVTLNNGYAGATNASGVYTIPVPPGSYTASASDPTRNCVTATPASNPVFVSSAGTSVQNFTIVGSSKLESNNAIGIDDSASGNNNGIVNKGECVSLNFGVKNNGCASESAISATLTTSTPGVTVLDSSSTYPNLAIDQSGTNATPFKISVSNSFVCGTNIAFSLNLTYANGTKSVPISIPTCQGGPNQTIPTSQILTTDSSMTDRLGRNGIPSTCAGKASPGGIGTTGTRNYKTFPFTNSAAASACITVTINAATGVSGTGDIEAVAYLNSFDPTQQSLNYLGDSGISGLGTTVGTVTFSFTVPASSNFVIVVETATGGTISSNFSGTLSGFYDTSSGPGICPASPAAPVLVSAASRLSGFDTPIPLSGSFGTESRDGNGNYAIVLTFDSPVQAGTASVASGTGSSGSVTFNGNDMIINLSGVPNQQRMTIDASNVTGTNGGVLNTAAVDVGFLIGDTNGDGQVNSADISQTKGQIGMTKTPANCREDVTNDGAIDSADVGRTKAASGTALP